MTPFTSLLVLENEDQYTQYKVDRGRKDHWAMYPLPAKIPVVAEPDPDAVALKAGKRPAAIVLPTIVAQHATAESAKEADPMPEERARPSLAVGGGIPSGGRPVTGRFGTTLQGRDLVETHALERAKAVGPVVTGVTVAPTPAPFGMAGGMGAGPPPPPPSVEEFTQRMPAGLRHRLATAQATVRP